MGDYTYTYRDDEYEEDDFDEVTGGELDSEDIYEIFYDDEDEDEEDDNDRELV